MKRLVVGMLAHVDAGKTTLSEGLLYTAGALRRLGRVDHGDAFLDTNGLERERGITIFSKQALLQVADTCLTLLDTPGHVDFSSEMERALQVLDYAVLVISGSDGVQSHTETLWRLLERYGVPVFLFVNKMDLAVASQAALLKELRQRLSSACTDFSLPRPALEEEAAMCSEALMDRKGHSGKEAISRILWRRPQIRRHTGFFAGASTIYPATRLWGCLWRAGLQGDLRGDRKAYLDENHRRDSTCQDYAVQSLCRHGPR